MADRLGEISRDWLCRTMQNPARRKRRGLFERCLIALSPSLICLLYMGCYIKSFSKILRETYVLEFRISNIKKHDGT